MDKHSSNQTELDLFAVEQEPLDWYAPLREIKSLGSITEKGEGIASLHENRRIHKGQFFTPDALARFLWDQIEPSVSKKRDFAWLFDNSLGSGRLFQFANPERHALCGLDIDAEKLARVDEAATQAGFSTDFVAASMVEAEPGSYHAGLINPPFSIHFESPLLERYPSNSFGKYGPYTSALSHVYAIEQALDCCRVVGAIVPQSAVDQFRGNDRLRRIVNFRRNLFAEENANARVSIMIFDSGDTGFEEVDLENLGDALAPLDLDLGYNGRPNARQIKLKTVDPASPTITLEPTGSTAVRLYKKGRRIALSFRCGFMQAKVMNAILGERIDYGFLSDLKTRIADGLKYTGEGALFLEQYLVEDGLSKLSQLCDRITEEGGYPMVDDNLRNYIAKTIRLRALQACPFELHIRTKAGMAAKGPKTAKALKDYCLDTTTWLSPVVSEGETVEILTDGASRKIAYKNKAYPIDERVLDANFEFLGDDANELKWIRAYDGKIASFPEIAKATEARARALGLDRWLTRDYQFRDLVEILMVPGAIIGWKMGLGKARLALALAMAGGRENLVVVEAHLIDEMIDELEKLEVPSHDWQIIDSPECLAQLRKINVISYSRLRMAVDPRKPKKTYGKALRGRISTMAIDEGDCIRNPNSQQTRAVMAIRPKRRYLLSGTPIANYPRDIFNLLVWTGGDGTSAQAFGRYQPFFNEVWRHNYMECLRGYDVFKDRFVTLEWCTNEFAEELSDGGKREVPVIKDVAAYRRALAPFVKRRVVEEPDVAEYVTIPKPIEIVREIPWDNHHLAYYLKVAQEFIEWYRKSETDTKKANLVAILARIQAVQFASSLPQHTFKDFAPYLGTTSKQRYAADRLAELAAEGRKTIMFAQSPELLQTIASLLANKSVDCILRHGKISRKQRGEDLNEFRNGNCPILLATFGVTKTGLNIPQADTVLFYERRWDAKTEAQAMSRVLRPQQTKPVTVEYLHLTGGIDHYQAQMVEFKAKAAAAGIDYMDQEVDKKEFLHLDTILGRFCEETSKMFGLENAHELREHLEQLTA